MQCPTSSGSERSQKPLKIHLFYLSEVKRKIKGSHNNIPYLISWVFHVPQKYLHPTDSCNKHPGKAKRIWDNDRSNQGHYSLQWAPSFPLSLAPLWNRVLINLIAKKHYLILNTCPWTDGWPAAALTKWDGLPCSVPPTVYREGGRNP